MSLVGAFKGLIRGHREDIKKGGDTMSVPPPLIDELMYYEFLGFSSDRHFFIFF